MLAGDIIDDPLAGLAPGDTSIPQQEVQRGMSPAYVEAVVPVSPLP